MDNFSEYEKLVDKWKTTGLLDGCKDLSEKIRLSSILEEIGDNLLHSNDESDEFAQKAGIMIPLAVRIFREGVEDIDYDRLLVVVDRLYPKLQPMVDESYSPLDAEMEFVCLCEEEYINLYGEKTNG